MRAIDIQKYWKEIREEALQIADTNKYKWLRSKEKNCTFYKYPLMWHGDKSHKNVGVNRSTCPKTCEYIDMITENDVGNAGFSMLIPGGRISTHKDTYFLPKYLYTINLGVCIPDGNDCILEHSLLSEPFIHKNGDMICHDARNLHQPINNSSENRIIFYCEVYDK